MQEVQERTVEAPDRDSPYVTVMKTWARWMKLDDKQHSTGDANPQDVKEFMACGEAVDVMIRDLPRVNRWALDKAHGITTAWIFPHIPIADALTEAENILTPKMRHHRDTQRFFYGK